MPPPQASRPPLPHTKPVLQVRRELLTIDLDSLPSVFEAFVGMNPAAVVEAYLVLEACASHREDIGGKPTDRALLLKECRDVLMRPDLLPAVTLEALRGSRLPPLAGCVFAERPTAFVPDVATATLLHALFDEATVAAGWRRLAGECGLRAA